MAFQKHRGALGTASSMGGGFMAVFGSIFICVGLGIGGFLYFPALFDWWQSRQWVEEPCWIERVEMKTSRGNKGSTTYTVEASYRYQYRGRTYHSERVGLLSGGDNIGDFQHRAYEELSRFAGQETPFHCLVNPAKPEQAILYRDLRWGLLLLMSAFPTIFTLVGGLVAFGGMAAAREIKGILTLQEQHPAAPWKWKREWAGSEITASKDGFGALLAITAWIYIVQLPLTAAVLASGALTESFSALAVFIPLALGLLPLRAVWKRLRMRQYVGSLSFSPRQWPMRPGTLLEGRLRFTQHLSQLASLEVKVLCRRKTTRGHGKQRSTTEEILWEQNLTLSAAQAQQEDQSWVLPLRLKLSPDFPGQDSQPSLNELRSPREIQWAMEVSGMPGMKPLSLPLPVFGEADKTFHDHSPAISEAESEAVISHLSHEQLEAMLKTHGIEAKFDAAGHPLSIFCPPGRNRAVAIGLLLFGTFWTGVFVVLILQNAPLLFKIIWGVSAPIIELIGLRMLLHQRLVEFSRDQMKVVNQIGPIHQKTETFEPHLIMGFKQEVYMTSNSTAYYRVRAETTYGKPITLADGITSENTAEKLKNSLQKWKEPR